MSDERVRQEVTDMTTRKGTLLTVMGLTVALIATGATARESRFQALKEKLTPNSNQPTVVAPDVNQDFNTVADLRPLHFDTNRAEARSADAPILDADAAWLRANPEHRVLIAGHADERGTTQYNMALGQRRAVWVRDQLIARGVPSDRIELMSFGEVRAMCRDKTQACWADKRRADILVARPMQPQRP
jgi:peptidoglycan-associated lipoprotein